MSDIVEEHYSPDGLLRLIVTRADDGETCIGFDKYAWHTHGDILAATTGLPESQAIRQFVQHIVGGNQIIAVARINGTIREVWPTDDPQGEFEFKPDEETVEFRRWNGDSVEISPPA